MTIEQGAGHILIVEDDVELAQWMQDYLVTKGYRVDVTGCGSTAVTMIQNLQPDVVILDGMLPNLDGIDVCKAVRPTFTNAIIMVTARDEEIDEVLGLEMGADDYLTKPVRARALLARIKKYLAKQQEERSSSVKQASVLASELLFGHLSINRDSLQVKFNDVVLNVSTHEFDVLWILASRAGEVVSRQELVNELRGFDYDGFDRSIDLKISRLRKKLSEVESNAERIVTVWGKGYLFAKDVS